MTYKRLFLTTALVTGFAMGALVSAPIMQLDGAAWAAGQGNGNGNGGAADGNGGGDTHDGGHDNPDAGNGGTAAPSAPSGNGGTVLPGGQKPDNDHGSPAWSQEGIPEVELGRLSVARSPQSVLDRAYEEALPTLAASASFYNLSFDSMVDALSQDWDALTLVDSPLANLALLKEALSGTLDLSAYGISNDPDVLAALFLGVASDKTVPITVETVEALSVIFGIPMTDAEIATLASQAEAIRIAILEGHG